MLPETTGLDVRLRNNHSPWPTLKAAAVNQSQGVATTRNTHTPDSSVMLVYRDAWTRHLCSDQAGASTDMHKCHLSQVYHIRWTLLDETQEPVGPAVASQFTNPPPLIVHSIWYSAVLLPASDQGDFMQRCIDGRGLDQCFPNVSEPI